MRINPILLFKPQVNNVENNKQNYPLYANTQLAADTVEFTGKIPRVRVYSSNGRNAVTRLAGQGVTCLCCGKRMIDPNVISEMDSKKLFNGSSHKILKALGYFEKYMKPLEKKVFRLLVSLEKEYPEKNLSKLLATKTKNLEVKLIAKQSEIFGEIYDYSQKHLPKEKLTELDEILQQSYDEMYGRVPKVTFGRKKFIGQIYKYSKDLGAVHQTNLLALAEKLPSSTTEFEAFIIKYARKSNREIAVRLLERSVGTIEHIKPRAEGGADSVYNYAIECAQDNWERGCRPMIEQIKAHPDMPQNAQKQINQIIKLVNKGVTSVNSEYVIKLKEALYRASGGVIDLDISRLKFGLPPKEIY